MGEEDFDRVNRCALSAIEVLKSTDNKDDVAKVLAKVYEEIDYLHAFYDGNSRTNRLYLDKLLDKKKENKLSISWNNINRRDFYLARDISLVKMTLKHNKNKEVIKLIKQTEKFINLKLEVSGIKDLTMENIFRNHLNPILANQKRNEKLQNKSKKNTNRLVYKIDK